MRRVKITKQFKNYKVGDTVYVTRNEAHELIDGGFGVISKDMTQADYRTAKSHNVKVKHGKSK